MSFSINFSKLESTCLQHAKTVMSSVVTHVKSAQRAVCVAAMGWDKTSSVELIGNASVIGFGSVLTVYSVCNLFKAKSKADALKYGLLAIGGAFVTWNQASRAFSDLTSTAIASCTSGSGNRFPGWKSCAEAALGEFSYLDDGLQYPGFLSCPTRP